ncbi:MAG: hypothetical protein E7048_06400 [Lentisphaerae bacterium]|nr:hypothetical protein [Lentisphaerota bacterium]
MKSKCCELLAPAGNLECALAAVDAGADAVYCGLGRFNARSRAENLDIEKLGSLLDFMHSRNRKLYLTFNTLLFEDELAAAGEMLSELALLSPDALIVHDPGVLHMARKYFPTLKVHGSTQMGIHNSAGVQAAAELGMERVILERQIPVKELERIVRRSPIEIEVFIHGSLCCSLSGRCLLSAELNGGSGNRGCCKQPCRRSFGTSQGEIFPLSMRDLNGVDLLPKLRNMGVASLKIEGRLRGPDYVWKCVHAYRILLDSPGEKVSPELLKEAQTLLNASSARNEISSFDPDKMIDSRRIGVFGRQVGTVENINRKGILVKALSRIHLGDRLRLVPPDGGDGMSFSLTCMEDRQKKINALSKGGMAFIPGSFSATPGWYIFKIGENGFDFSRQAASLAPRRQGVTLELEVSADQWQCSIAELPGFLWQYRISLAAADRHPATKEQISDGFSSGVPAPWKVDSCHITFKGIPFFLPGAVLKEIRRNFWQDAEKALKEADFASLKKRALDSFINALETEKGSPEIPEPQAAFEIPGFISESDLPEWEQKIARAAKSGVRFFRAGGIHALTLLKNIPEAQLTGVFPLSVTNSQCAALLKENGFISAAFSPELPPKTIPELLSRSPLPLYRTTAPVPLLVSRTKLAPEGIWQERSGTKLLLAFDSEEKLWKLWKK